LPRAHELALATPLQMNGPANSLETPSVTIFETEHDTWAGLLGVSSEQVRAAIAAVGPRSSDVRRYLGARAGRSGRGAASVMEHLKQDAAAYPHTYEVAVATSEGADALLRVVPPLLRLIKQRLQADVVFVSQFVNGKRVFRYVEVPADARVIEADGADPLEASWCQKVVDGRLPQAIPDAGVLQDKGILPAAPFPIGTHLSIPILMEDGSIYGTLCCFSFAASDRSVEEDLTLLRAAAELLAERLAELELRQRHQH